MDPPPPPPPTVASATQLGYPDSVESSPRSRNADSWDEPLPPIPGAKLRLMCSYGGHIVPRPHDKFLCYVGGETRMVVVDRHSSLADLSARLSRSLLRGRSFTLKYQLPNEDLDSLISVTTDEDLENMIEEYDRNTTSSLKPSRLRLFLFPIKPETSSSIGSLLDDSKSENWFLDALNGAGILPRGASSDAASVNCLLGLDDVIHADPSADVEAQPESLGSQNKQVNNKHGQDVQSVPDSPMMETTSSFGSTSSSPSQSNLPPIRVRVEDGGVRLHDQMVGLEEHFSQMNVAAAAAAAATQKQEEGFVTMYSPPPVPTTVAAAAMASSAATGNIPTVASENPGRVLSDDERSDRSDHGVSVGYRKPPQPQLQQRTSGGADLQSPDAAARDANSSPKPVFYQDSVAAATARDNRVPAIPIDRKSNISDPSYRFQMQQQQQLQDAGYVFTPQLDQHQLQQQQQQFIPAGSHYIHHHPTGPVPISSYYPLYHSAQQQQQQHPHQQLDQQYPMYYMPVRQTQAYNLPVQSNLGDASTVPSSRPPAPPVPAMIPPSAAAYKEPAAPVYPPRSAALSKPELATNVYRTAAAAAAAAAGPQFIHMSPDQHQQQILGYHQMHHPSQSIAVAAAGAGNYAYEFPDPTHAQIYYPQPSAATLPPQYQTMTSAGAVVMSEASTQLPIDISKHQLQNRTSQPL
ncbi:uncharacterized protein LOC122081269 [Macadamia integrifolia]|uniref:uncharacterized protein LOC122081269 n=1 Tax=Macadamia integrifolia TaxID=60698 RepID=UPI001C4FBD3E|nr:uncharacterized protein LOC122081269 [Macadamia integrifolia]